MKKIYEIIQEEKSDCGVCSLASIILFHGGYIPLEQLRINTNTDCNGTNAYELINCAKMYGFNAYGKKISKLNNIKFPVIVHLKLKNNLFHFVVVYKITKKNIYIMDPSIGIKKMKLKSFYEIFTGIVLYFEPINIIPKYKKNNFINSKIKEEIRNNKNKYIKIMFFNILVLLFSIVISLEIRILNINKNYIYFLLFIIVMNELIIYIKNKYLLNLSLNFNDVLIKNFISHIFKLPLNYLKLKRKGEISTRFNDINELGITLVNTSIEIIFYVLICIIIIFVLFFISFKITSILFVITLLYIYINIKIYNKLINEIRFSINLEESYNSNILDYINNIETIININKLNYFKKNIFYNVYNKNENKKTLNEKIYKMNFINNLITNLLYLIMIFVIIFNKYNTINSLTIFILFNYFIENIKLLINYYPKYLLIKLITSKSNDFLSFSNKELPKINNKFNNIQIKNLSYKLNNNIILDKINFDINNKDKIIIKGPSGIGKSTLMRILIQEIKDYSGIITKDNINIKKYNINNLISYVSQNESLFDDTIYNNITLEEKINDKELANIIKICRIDKIVEHKTSKLNSIVINNSNISGGEKNRIILARSLIHSKKILILDEVMKEVDETLEIAILKDLLENFKDKTIIYISHKNVDFLFQKCLTLGKEK